MKIKNPFSRQNIFVLIPLILVMIIDFVFTVVGQPETYWQNHNYFNEGSPLGQILMLNPAHFIIFFVFYILFVIVLAGILPRPVNITVALGFYLGHIWGSSTWLGTIFYKITGDEYILIYGSWYLTVGYFAAIAIISGFCINKWLKKNLADDKQ
jgi:hypothetical protein